MASQELLLNLATIVSPWLSIGGGIVGLAYKLAPYLNKVLHLYANFTIASEKQAEALKEIAQGVKIAVADIHEVKAKMPTVCGYLANGECKASQQN